MPAALHYHPREAVRTLDRYIFRELLVPFFLGLGVFTFILLIARILKLVEMVVNRGVPAWEIVKLFSYILPAFLEVTVPMALLLAILVGFGRMSSDSEITAMKACGLSLYQLARPVVVFTLVVWLVSLGLSVWVRPWGNSLLRTGLYEVAKSRASVGLRERVFNTDFPNLVIYVDEVLPPGNSFKGVMISDLRDAGQPTTAFAKVGMLVHNEETSTLTLRLLEGQIEQAKSGSSSFNQTDFALYDFNLDWAAALGEVRPEDKDPKEMTLQELRRAIAAKDSMGEPSFPEQVEVHRKFSIPFACLVFAAVGVPLGLQSSRSARSRGFSVSLALILAYYILLTMGEKTGARGIVPPLLALWLPNIVFAAVGAYLFAAAASERRLLPLDRLEQGLGHLRQRIAARFGTAG